MSKSIIFCFTGTGNSLKVANDISTQLSNCFVTTMGKNDKSKYIIDNSIQNIGFVFPVYYLGIPLQVKEFIENMYISYGEYYIFAVATCGRFCGNAIRQVNEILKQKGRKLNYGNYVQMGDNAIILYQSNGTNDSIERNYFYKITNIIQDIQYKRNIQIKKELRIISHYHNIRMKNIFKTDKKYYVSNNCILCGICEKICPVKNIKITNGSIQFQHHCQQCMACIQLCPQYAINYNNKTEKRKRYHNVNISVQDLIQLQNQKPW